MEDLFCHPVHIYFTPLNLMQAKLFSLLAGRVICPKKMFGNGRQGRGILFPMISMTNHLQVADVRALSISMTS
jgi:hypothetical protein